MPNTLIIKSDRVTMSPLTADPTSCVAGDMWFRQDLGESRWAIDTVVANAAVMAVYPVMEADISNGAVTTAKIADLGVTEGKIAAGAVTGGKIADSAVATAKIADGAISTAKIADSAVATAKIADGAVASGKIADSAIATAKIVDSAVTDAKVATGIGPGKIGTGNMSLGTGTLSAGQVTVGDIALKYNWRIAETPEALLFVQNGKIIGKITKAGFMKGR